MTMFTTTAAKQPEIKAPPTKTECLMIDPKTKWAWYHEEVSYLFHPTSQIVNVRIVIVSNNSFNIYAEIDLKNKLETKFLDNKKTLAAAKKFVEEFIKVSQREEFISNYDGIEFIQRNKLIQFGAYDKDLMGITEHFGTFILAKYSTHKEAKEALKYFIETGEVKSSKKGVPKEELTEPKEELNSLEALVILKEELKK